MLPFRCAYVSMVAVLTLSCAMHSAFAADSWRDRSSSETDIENMHELAGMPLAALLELEVTGASKFSQSVRSAPSSATVITSAEIRALGYRSLSDVLNSVRGLNVNSDRAYSYLGVRGVSTPGDYNTRVLLLIDGNRINDGVFDQAFLGTEFPLDLDLVERVEFIPGPGSAVHGANALFGVINVVTRRSMGGKNGTASVSAGSGRLRTATATLQTGEAGGLNAMVSASRTTARGGDLYFPQYDSPDTRNGWSVGTDAERQSRLFVRLEDGAGFRATLIHADRLKGAPATASTVFGDAATRSRDVQTHGSFQWTGRALPDVEVTARAYASRNRYVGDFLMDYPPVTLNRDEVDAQSRGIEARAVTTRWSGHKLVTGFELQRSPRRNQSNFDVEPYATYLDDRRNGHRMSLFAEDQIEINPQWSLSVGGRFDRTETNEGVLSPRLGAVWQPNSQWTLKYLYGSAYRQANAFERYYEFPGEGGYKGNAVLRNEKVRGHEIAMEYRPNAALRWKGSFYRNGVSNLIVQNVDPDDGLLVFNNVGSFSTRGVEIEAEAALPLESRLRINYARQLPAGPAEIRKHTARNIAHMALITPLIGQWTVGVSTSAIGARGQAAGFGTTDVTISNDAPWRDWRVAFSVYNLFDRRASDPSTDLAMPGTIPQDGRGARVKLDLRF